MTYTDNGLPETLTDGAGNVSILVYDGFDRLSRLRYPNATGGGTSATDYEDYGYDAASNVTSYRNRAGQTFALAYDARNRLESVDAPVGTPDVDYAYDNLDRTLTTSSPGGQTLAYAWDALSRLTSETGPRGVMAYQYDLGGRRTRITWPDSFYVTYSHDLYGGLKTADENGVTNLIGIYYDDLGQRTTITRLNGATTLYGYDPVSRLSGLIQDLDGSSDDLTLAFAYNPAGQMVSRSVSNGAYVYAPATGSTAYANNGRNQITDINAASVTTDTRGDITALPGAPAYGYDAAGRLTSAGSADYAFDPAGRLYEVDGASDVRFQYDGLQLATEYDFAGVATARHIPGAGLDEVIVSYSGGGLSTRSFPVTDERLSVIALTDGSGAATQINTYDEYGVPASGNAGRFQYTGQQWLPDAGLYHYRARAYAANVGRFTGPDPIGYAAGANLYGYVGGDPVNLIDPLGLNQDGIEIPVEWFCSWSGTLENPYETFLGCIETDWMYFSYGRTGGGNSFGWSGGGGGGGHQTEEPLVCILERPTGEYRLGPNADPRFQPAMAQALSRVFADLNRQGIIPYMTSGYRTSADQARMRSGGSGRNPAATVSNHQTGLSVDVNTLDGNFSAIHDAMIAQGLTWGGTFTHVDRPHFQLPPRGTPADPAMAAACERASGR